MSYYGRITFAAYDGMGTQHMDVTTDFMYAEIDEEVHMEMPKGMMQAR